MKINHKKSRIPKALLAKKETNSPKSKAPTPRTKKRKLLKETAPQGLDSKPNLAQQVSQLDVLYPAYVKFPSPDQFPIAPKNLAQLPNGYVTQIDHDGIAFLENLHQVFRKTRNTEILISAFCEAHKLGMYPPRWTLDPLVKAFRLYAERLGQVSLEHCLGLTAPEAKSRRGYYLKQKQGLRDYLLCLHMFLLTKNFNLSIEQAAPMVELYQQADSFLRGLPSSCPDRPGPRKEKKQLTKLSVHSIQRRYSTDPIWKQIRKGFEENQKHQGFPQPIKDPSKYISQFPYHEPAIPEEVIHLHPEYRRRKTESFL